MNTWRELTRRVLRRAGATPPVTRLLSFYQREGLVPPAVDPAPEATPTEAPTQATGATATPAAADEIAQLHRSLASERAERLEIERTWDRFLPGLGEPSWDDLTDQLPDEGRPPLDRSDVDPATLTDDQRQWWEQGFVIKRDFIPHDLIDAYWAERSKLESPFGWQTGSPFLYYPDVLNLSVHRPLVDLLGELIGEPMAVNLNLTGLVSTERNWHQDDYLNAPLTMGWYAAVWFAIGDTDPESGPFQYVPGSHRWPMLRRERVRLFLDPKERYERDSHKLSERFLDKAAVDEIERRRAPIETFIGRKGDILIWHACLLHRGSPPQVPGRQRLSFISHYTGLNHWALGPQVGHHENGAMYFLTGEPLDAAAG